MLPLILLLIEDNEPEPDSCKDDDDGCETDGTTKQSIPSNTTVEEPSQHNHTSTERFLSDTESLNEIAIKHKIEEANQLIARVKRALEKMKSAKTKQLIEDKKDVDKGTSSSTDMEETLKNLTKETERLITRDAKEAMLGSDVKKPKTRRRSRGSIEKSGSLDPISQNTRRDSKDREKTSSGDLLNKTFVRESEGRQWDGSSNESDDAAPESIPNQKPSFEELKNARKISVNGALTSDSGRNMDMLDLQRPVTRRNEIEEDVADELNLEKFRNSPEDGQTSSLEELQAKLQTISESTESSFSSPRNKKNDDQNVALPASDVQSCGCGTDLVTIEDKETQIEPEKKGVGTGCHCESENKETQTIVASARKLSLSTGVDSLIPPPKQLETTNLVIQDIPTLVKCPTCEAENLPVIEVASRAEKIMCDKCKKQLKEEHLPGVSIPSKLKKLPNLTIKVLPPIIINPQMVVKQVLNFFITCKGETQNMLEGSENAAFIVIKRSSSHAEIKRFSDTEINRSTRTEMERTSNIEQEIPNENISQSDTGAVGAENQGENLSTVAANFKKEKKGKKMPMHNILSEPESNSSMKNKDSGFFKQLRDHMVKNLNFSEELGDDPTVHFNLDEETRKKLLIYKSYNIYDNINRHDPGGLDQRCADKVSTIDLNFYKTFINPTGKISEKDMFLQSKTGTSLGFESKGVQCSDDSLLLTSEQLGIAPVKIADCKRRITQESQKQFINKKPIFNVKLPRESAQTPPRNKLSVPDESEVTVVKVRRSIHLETAPLPQAQELPDSSNDAIQQSYQTNKSLDSKALISPSYQTQKSLDPSKDLIINQSYQTHESLDPSKDLKMNQSYPTDESLDPSKNLIINQSYPTDESLEPSKDMTINQSYRADEPLHPFNDLVHQSYRTFEETELSTPSSITVTISYSQSSEEGSSHTQNMHGPSQEVEIKSTDLDQKLKPIDSDSKIKLNEKILSTDLDTPYIKLSDVEQKIESTDMETKPTDMETNRQSTDTDTNEKRNDDDVSEEPKILTVKDMDVIHNLRNKFKSVDPDASEPVLTVKHDSTKNTSVYSFIKNLTRINSKSDEDKSCDEDKSFDEIIEDIEPSQSHDVNYHLIDPDFQNQVKLYSKHLILAKNGRYKDEENLFTQHPYPKPANQNQASSSQKPVNKDAEVQISKLEEYPRHKLDRYSPDTTNSDTVTTNSLSEGEVRCKHSVSNGEIHVCQHKHPRFQRNIVPRSNFTSTSITQTQNMPVRRNILPRSNLTNASFNPTVNIPSQRNILPQSNPSPTINMPSQRNILPQSNPSPTINMPSQRNILPQSNPSPTVNMPSQRSILPQSYPSPTVNMPSQRSILPRSNLTSSSISPNCQRSILTRSNLAKSSNDHNYDASSLRNFSLTDPNVTIEKRRNYFNNWVTYYVKTQEISDSSTSSCSHNK